MENSEYEIPKRATLSVGEVAKILSVGKNTVYQGIQTKTIPTIGIGRTKRIPTNWIVNLLAEWNS